MTHEYTANGKRIALSVDHDYLAVRFHEDASRRARAAVIRETALGPFQHRFEVPGERLTIHPVAHAPTSREERHADALEEAGARTEVRRVSPVYRRGRQHIVATDRVIIGLRRRTRNVDRLLTRLGASVVERDGSEYLIVVPDSEDPLQVCAELDAMDEVEFAEPDFVTLGHHAPRRPPAGVSSGSKHQGYALDITKALEAWKKQVGDPRITIAVIDEGVQTEHESLKRAITMTYDATQDHDVQEPESWDAHGTACAGLAAAVADREHAMRGVGSGCSLMAVRIGYTASKNGKYVTKGWWVKRGIDWAWQHGADVLSNSWGGVAESTVIARALERARTKGRGGKGCVVVTAAGNEEIFDGRIDFPGNLAEVLTVSASNQYDQPKTIKSKDNERWWGSSYGPEVDVAAPGVDNYTTDNVGAAGFTNGDFVSDFNGTSSATPIVAGAAALVLCADAELTEAEVRAILRDSADQVGSIPYVDGRNDHMGCGRVNVLAAVEAALSRQRSLTGTLKQAAVSGGRRKVPALVLDADDGNAYLLRTHAGSDGKGASELESKALASASRYVGKRVMVTYSHRQRSALGTALWGVSISSAPRRAPNRVKGAK